MSCSVMGARIHGIHLLLAALATPLLPNSLTLIPSSARGRCRALLLLLWLLPGLLIPTLQLLPPAARQQQRRPALDQGGEGGAVGVPERWLALLAWPEGELDQLEQVHCVLRWWVVACVAWAACCVVAGP